MLVRENKIPQTSSCSMHENVRGLSDIVKRRSFRANVSGQGQVDLSRKRFAQLSKHFVRRILRDSNRGNVLVGGA